MCVGLLCRTLFRDLGLLQRFVLLQSKPIVIVSFILCSAVVVGCLFQKPCWCGCMSILFVMCGRMFFF